jgi:hypothetical protein
MAPTPAAAPVVVVDALGPVSTPDHVYAHDVVVRTCAGAPTSVTGVRVRLVAHLHLVPARSSASAAIEVGGRLLTSVADGHTMREAVDRLAAEVGALLGSLADPVPRRDRPRTGGTKVP